MDISNFCPKHNCSTKISFQKLTYLNLFLKAKRCKMFSHIKKILSCLIIALPLFGSFGATFSWYNYPTSSYWYFKNNSYLSFNQVMNFTDFPNKGEPYDRTLVGYWNMNEGSGVLAYDSSGNGNNAQFTVLRGLMESMVKPLPSMV